MSGTSLCRFPALELDLSPIGACGLSACTEEAAAAFVMNLFTGERELMNKPLEAFFIIIGEAGEVIEEAAAAA